MGQDIYTKTGDKTNFFFHFEYMSDNNIYLCVNRHNHFNMPLCHLNITGGGQNQHKPILI